MTFENIHKLRIRRVDCHKLPARHHRHRCCHRCCMCRQDNKSCNRLDTETPHKAAKGSSGDPCMIYNHAAAARFPRFSTAIKATSDELCMLIIGGKSSHSHGVYQATACAHTAPYNRKSPREFFQHILPRDVSPIDVFCLLILQTINLSPRQMRL